MAKKMETTEQTTLPPTEVAAAPITSFVSHEDDPMLDLSACERLVGRSRHSIRRWIDDGALRAIRDPSGLVRVRKSELAKFYNGTAWAQTRPIKEETD